MARPRRSQEFVDQERAKAFEDEVRQIASNLWPADELGGATKLGGKERDGLYVTPELVNLVEATTSRRKDKAETDINKLVKAIPGLRRQYPDRAVRGWFITLEDPTADQLDVARKHRGEVVAEPVSKFRARLLDSKLYLDLRAGHPFGSAQDPETQSRTNLPDYIPLDLLEPATGEVWTVKHLSDSLSPDARLVLLGDFGAGKSMTLRELFLRARGDFLTSRRERLPIHLNLREHHGQTEPAEALERHARLLGFPQPSHLVRAWRSGRADVLLDGFDELGSAGWMGSTRRMAAVRHTSVGLIRNFAQAAPPGTAVAIAGREHFFDSPREMQEAFGLLRTFTTLTLNEFSDEQIRGYLKRRQIDGPVPAWLPGRPLLLAYLAGRGFLADAVALGQTLTPAGSWDALLDRICAREAAIDVNLDGQTVREILERLSSAARATTDGRGPLSYEELTAVFSDVCGYAPDDKGMVLLQRLPGLGLHDDALNSRQFIDDGFADICRAGDVGKFVIHPYGFEQRRPADWSISLGTLGVDLTANRIAGGFIPAGQIRPAIEVAADQGWMTLASDVARVAMAVHADISTLRRTFIREVEILTLELSTPSADYSPFEFQDCLIHQLEIDPGFEGRHLPTFRGCLIGTVDGRVSIHDLPADRFISCQIEAFGESTQTTAAIMGIDATPGVRVALTILKKLYVQSGSGRKENAFFRGLDQNSQRLVPDVLKLIEHNQLAIRTKAGGDVIWLPVRPAGARVRTMLAAPVGSEDALLAACKDL